MHANVRACVRACVRANMHTYIHMYILIEKIGKGNNNHLVEVAALCEKVERPDGQCVRSEFGCAHGDKDKKHA
jgi:hypothetical protein